MMEDLKSIPSHAPSVVATKTGSEYVLVPVRNNIADMNTMFTLNETGAFIWELIDGQNSVENIIEIVMRYYEVDFNAASKDVTAFMQQMKNYLVIKS
jgi:hypothetical protein